MGIDRQDWIYPRWSDQVQYLRDAYQSYEYSLDHGFLPAAGRALASVSPQGTLHEFYGLLMFWLCGPSRASALAINMLSFLALQTCTFLAVRRLSPGSGVAWMAVGFLAALLKPWSGDSASAIDFRLDWMAACFYGMALAAAVACNGFRSTRWAVPFGVAVGAVLLTRTLTAVYFAVIFSALLAGMLARRSGLRRCGRLVLSAGTAAVMAGPVYWIKRRTLFDYYWIGHVTGPERALRDSHLDATASLRWIADQILFLDVGLAAMVLCLASLGALWALRAVYPARAEASPVTEQPMLGALGLTLVFLLAPVAVLFVHPVKASQPLTIVLAPVVWLAVLGCLGLARGSRRDAVAVAGAAVAVAGLLVFSALVSANPLADGLAMDARKVNALADYIYFRSEECGLQRPRVAVTLIAGGIDAEVLSVVGYERHRHWLTFEQTLPNGLFRTTQQDVLQQLERSDFVCLVTKASSSWPFDRQLLDLLPVTRTWCEANLKHLADLEALGESMAVYERSTLRRPDGGTAVNLPSMLRRSSTAESSFVATPPAPPAFASSPHFLLSDGVECGFRLNAPADAPHRFLYSDHFRNESRGDDRLQTRADGGRSPLSDLGRLAPRGNGGHSRLDRLRGVRRRAKARLRGRE